MSAPYFIVLRTGKKPYRGRKPTLSDLLPKGPDGKPIGKTITLDYDVVDLPAWTWDMLRGGPVLRLTFGMLKAMLEGEGDGAELPEAMLPILEIADEEIRIDLSKISLDFAALAMAAHNHRLDEALVNEALKPIFKDKERFMIATIFQEREAIGEARGEARGKVLAILQTRFDRVPKATEKTVRSMVDVTALESLAMHAKTCQSLNDFAKALKLKTV